MIHPYHVKLAVIASVQLKAEQSIVQCPMARRHILCLRAFQSNVVVELHEVRPSL